MSMKRPYASNERDTNEDGSFEKDFVYTNEGGANPTEDAMNAARRRFPFDWANLPPSSSLFQAQQALFVNDPLSQAAPFVKETFEAIEAEKVLPPDTEKEDQQEASDLAAYKSPVTGGKVADEKSVEDMIKNLYGKKGFIPKVAKKSGDIYEITDMVPKEPKIVYEDEIQQASIQSNELDPLYDPSMAILRPDVAREADLQIGVPPRLAGERTTPGRQPLSAYSPTLQETLGPRMAMQNFSA